MENRIYNNPDHWKDIHNRFTGTLKSVGRSGLSETYNRYKYWSEEETFSKALSGCIWSRFKKEKLEVLEIGAGIGYWLNVVNQQAGNNKIKASLTALDLSENAISEIKKNIPGVSCILENAGLVNPMFLESRFDLVMANYCLHHITQSNQFMNALELAVNSVKPGGYLLLMDCFIDRVYSPYYDVDVAEYKGSGLARPLKIVDKVCEEHLMRLIHMADPISYLMNNVLEADSERDYRLKSFIWKIMHRLYKSDLASRCVLPFIIRWDRFLKTAHKGYSTRLLIYQKQGIGKHADR
jgi:SAM-dependent methyltransferase